jgi:D-arabinose 1-dehydrogenase-like Zn-dependent alcohol dehydrogenase
MARVFALVAEGKIAAQTVTAYPFERAREAIVDLGARRIVGKAVIHLQ